MSAPYWSDGQVSLYLGDCLSLLPSLPGGSVDAVVTDPPYELAFMGRRWDASGVAHNPAIWRECLRVLRPGGHLLAFGGTRTYHRLACAIEDAGLEIRDSLHWIYGSGFPKSLDVSKAIDKAAGAEREVVGKYELPDVADGRRAKGWECTNTTEPGVFGVTGQRDITAPATEDAARWDGWGTALKPSHEPIVLARKPLGGTVAANVLEHGTGALNIDGCRVAGPAGDGHWTHKRDIGNGTIYSPGGRTDEDFGSENPAAGRWPPNVLLGPDAAAELDRQSGVRPSGGSPSGQSANTGLRGNTFTRERTPRDADNGGASRFFPVFRYEAKAASAERPRLPDGTAHPTVKPLDLMRWLVRLVTPPGGLVLDPFCGSGTTGEAARAEGFRAVLIDNDAASAELARVRLAKASQPAMFGSVA